MRFHRNLQPSEAVYHPGIRSLFSFRACLSVYWCKHTVDNLLAPTLSVDFTIDGLKEVLSMRWFNSGWSHDT